MGIENAVFYRLVSYIAGSQVADGKWGYKYGSPGYKEAERIFKNKYHLISLDQFKDEIVLSWCAESAKRKRIQMSAANVLGKEAIDEDHRSLLTRITKRIKEQNRANNLSGIPEEVIDRESEMNKLITVIDNAFNEIIRTAKNRETDLHFSIDEIEGIVSALDEVEQLHGTLDDGSIDVESFYETMLKMYTKKMQDSNIPPKTYTEEMTKAIRTIFYSRQDTLINVSNTRSRTKNSIFEKVDDGRIEKMAINDFSAGYDEIIELYDPDCDRIKNIDELTNFYSLESKYNLVFYVNVALQLADIGIFDKKELVIKLSELALTDLYIYRSSAMKRIVSEMITGLDDRDVIIENIRNLLKLKSAIVNDLLAVRSLDYEDMKEEAFNLISDNALEEVNSQIQKLNVANYLDLQIDHKMIQRVFKNLKLLLMNNKYVLLHRNSIINQF